MLGQAAKGKWGEAWEKGVQRPKISLGVGSREVWDSPAARFSQSHESGSSVKAQGAKQSPVFRLLECLGHDSQGEGWALGLGLNSELGTQGQSRKPQLGTQGQGLTSPKQNQRPGTAP